MIKYTLQFFGGRGSAGARGGGGMSAQEKEDKKVEELDKEGHFRYHATTERAVSGIRSEGLKPSRGQYGEGVYFAKSSESAEIWADTSTGGKIVVRVNNRALVKAGYDEFPGKSEQGWADKAISNKDIEIRTNKGQWIPIKDAVVSYNKGKATIIKRPKR